MKKGFTLCELFALLTLIAILAMLFCPKQGKQEPKRDETKQKVAREQLK